MHSLPRKEKNIFWGRCKCGGKRRSGKGSGCNSIVLDIPIETPDLAIYSQEEELLNGNTPNWNSPDITTNDWKPFRLRSEVTFRIRNLSPTVPAIGVSLHYYTSPFGIGTRKELKLTKIVNISPAREIELKFPLDQLTFSGDPRVGVHLQIEHPFDQNLINNFGSQVHDQGYTSESGRDFNIQIPVLNDSNLSREIRLSIMPTDLIAVVTPAAHLCAPHEQIISTLRIQIPSHLSGTPEANIIREVTVVGRLPTSELIGGATRIVCIDN
jgi:hypothetical protein